MQPSITMSSQRNPAIMLLCIVLLACSSRVDGFVASPRSTRVPSTLLFVDKKTNAGAKSKGFGKSVEPKKIQPMEEVARAIDTSSSVVYPSNVLKSVEGGSSAVPQIDSSVPVEERTKSILREQYGLRTLEEQQEAQRKQESINKQRKKLQEWKKLADEGQDFDIMQILPAPLLIGIDRFLKAGVVICTVLFVLSGMLITVEAYSKATNSALPPDLDSFIVNTIEPNFTPGLGVLLGFSISLGAFAAAQLSSASSSYREGR